MNSWQKQKEQHDHAWVTYNNYQKVLEKNLSTGEDTNEQNIIPFNATEPNVNNTITSWYNKLSKLYCFLPATDKGIGKTLIQDRWRVWLPTMSWQNYDIGTQHKLQDNQCTKSQRNLMLLSTPNRSKVAPTAKRTAS